MGYTVLQPHSSTNPTGKYWVVDYDHWQQCVNNNQIERIQPMRDFDDYGDALAFQDELNANESAEPPNDPLWKLLDDIGNSKG